MFRFSRRTWYRSLGGALKACNITVWTASASVCSSAGDRWPLVTSIFTRGIVAGGIWGIRAGSRLVEAIDFYG